MTFRSLGLRWAFFGACWGALWECCFLVQSFNSENVFVACCELRARTKSNVGMQLVKAVEVSTGVHQEFGPCDAMDIDLMGFERKPGAQLELSFRLQASSLERSCRVS